jgi:hypothetical protein
LKATFAAKLAASRRFVRDGKRVRRAEKTGGAASEEAEEEPEEPLDEDEEVDEEEDEEARLARLEHNRQRPSYIAWHSAPKAQRFGQFRCATHGFFASAVRRAY